MNKSKFIFTGVVIKEDAGISALCIEVDIASDGDTVEEAKSNLIEAVSLYIETAIENNLSILRPVPNDENPLITNPQNIVEKFTLKIDFDIHVYA